MSDSFGVIDEDGICLRRRSPDETFQTIGEAFADAAARVISGTGKAAIVSVVWERGEPWEKDTLAVIERTPAMDDVEY